MKIFSTLGWAIFKDWDGRFEGEHPSAYIVQLLDKVLEQFLLRRWYCMQSILLGAVRPG
jgi:hypothetical protein